MPPQPGTEPPVTQPTTDVALTPTPPRTPPSHASPKPGPHLGDSSCSRGVAVLRHRRRHARRIACRSDAAPRMSQPVTQKASDTSDRPAPHGSAAKLPEPGHRAFTTSERTNWIRPRASTSSTPTSVTPTDRPITTAGQPADRPGYGRDTFLPNSGETMGVPIPQRAPGWRCTPSAAAVNQDRRNSPRRRSAASSQYDRPDPWWRRSCVSSPATTTAATTPSNQPHGCARSHRNRRMPSHPSPYHLGTKFRSPFMTSANSHPNSTGGPMP